MPSALHGSRRVTRGSGKLRSGGGRSIGRSAAPPSTRGAACSSTHRSMRSTGGGRSPEHHKHHAVCLRLDSGERLPTPRRAEGGTPRWERKTLVEVEE